MKKTLFSALAVFILLLSTRIPVNAQDNINGGGFFDSETNMPSSNVDSDASILATPPSCNQVFYHSVSTVPMQIANVGGDYRSLMWGFNLTSTTKELLGPIVTVSMPSATINDRPINPPYAPHTESVTYNFHGSLKNYQYIGGSYTLKKGDIVNLNWLITKTSDPSKEAYRYIRCQVNW